MQLDWEMLVEAMGDIVSSAVDPLMKQIAALEQSNGELVDHVAKAGATILAQGQLIKDLERQTADRFTAVDEAVTNVAKMEGPAGKDADAEAIGDKVHQELTHALKGMVEDLVPSMIPDPIPGPAGPAGPQGERGESVDPEAVSLMLKDMIPDPIVGPAGPAGPQGERGADGADGPQGERGADGPQGESVDPEAVSLMLKDMIPDPIVGPAGPAGPQGEGVDMDMVEEIVGKMVGENVENLLPSHIPDPIVGPAGPAGPQGERGADGADGADGERGADGEVPDVSELIEESIVRVERSVMGQLATMVKEAMPEAPQAIGPTDLQVIRAVEAVYPTIRQDLIKRLPAMEHKGVWQPDAQYDVGDEVIKNGSTYRLMEPSTDQPPAEAWQMVSQGKLGKKGAPGNDGPAGPAGPAGKDGVGIKDMVWAEGRMMVIELTNGDVKEFDMTEFVELVIKAIGE